MILTVAQAREHVTTALSDDAVLSMLTAAEADITAAAGVMGAQTEYVRGGFESLVLDHLMGTATSVTELSDTDSALVLATDDYRIDGYILHRLTTGTNPRAYWLGLVKVIHTPPEAEAERVRAQVALLRLELAIASGVSSESIGDYAVSYASGASLAKQYADQRAAILEPLKPAMVR